MSGIPASPERTAAISSALNAPTGTGPTSSTAAPPAAASNDVTVLVRGQSLGGWQDVRITRNIDAMPNSFEIRATEISPEQPIQRLALQELRRLRDRNRRPGLVLINKKMLGLVPYLFPMKHSLFRAGWGILPNWRGNSPVKARAICWLFAISVSSHVQAQTIVQKSFVVTMSVEVRRGEVFGKTNLPDGMQLMCSLFRGGAPFSMSGAVIAQDNAEVRQGAFHCGPFSAEGTPIQRFRLEVTSPLAELEPEPVRKVIGEKGEFLSGRLTTSMRNFVQKSSGHGDTNLFADERIVVYSLTTP